MSPNSRCEWCRLPPELCICAGLPRLGLPFRLVLIRHPGELSSQSNTGALLPRLFEGAEAIDYGALMQERRAPWRPHTDHAVLFPLPGAPVLSAAAFPARPARERALVVLDGTWGQASKMSRRVPGIRRFPFVALPAETRPRWTLRKPARPGRLATAEAVAAALELLDLAEEAQRLRQAHALMAARILQLRGKISRRQLEVLERKRAW
jgi:DTW domain-containing protein YfiP